MKIDLNSVDKEVFYIKEGNFFNQKAFLVTPKEIGLKWTQENSIFRSSIWSENGELLSAGFKKFTNWGENPDNFPVPTSLDGTVLVDKLDGSLLIVNVNHNKELNFRTRGTFNVDTLPNGFEILELQRKYKNFFDFLKEEMEVAVTECSFLFEWVSSLNRIVLSYPDCPDMYLIGVVHHFGYTYWGQEDLDNLAMEFDLKRPKKYNFDSIENMMEVIKKGEGLEGCCIYSNKDQSIHKYKADKYLMLHRLKSELSSFDKLVDLYFSQKLLMQKKDFEKFIEETFDFEILKICEDNIYTLFQYLELVLDRFRAIKYFVEQHGKLPRKEFALLAQKKHQGFESYCFEMLDKGQVAFQNLKKMMYKIIELDKNLKKP